MDDADWQRLERFRGGDEQGWSTVTSRGPRAPDDRAWTRWLAGELPDYPEQILQANYREVCRRLQTVMADEQDLTKMDVHHWQQVNPVLTEALVHNNVASRSLELDLGHQDPADHLLIATASIYDLVLVTLDERLTRQDLVSTFPG